jgi:hypothetical protein
MQHTNRRVAQSLSVGSPGPRRACLMSHEDALAAGPRDRAIPRPCHPGHRKPTAQGARRCLGWANERLCAPRNVWNRLQCADPVRGRRAHLRFFTDRRSAFGWLSASDAAGRSA